MTILIYNLCFFHKSSLLKIVNVQINNIPILANKNLTSKEKKVVRNIKIKIKD